MVSAARTAQSIEITAENLEEELRRLEAQRQALERELAAVVAHLGSVRTTLNALQDLMRAATPASGEAAAGVAVPKPVRAKVTEAVEPTPSGPAPAPDGAGVARAEPEARPQRPEGQQKQKKQKKPTRTARRGERSDRKTDGQYGRLTEQIMDFFAGTGGADVRARDVAAALGRDTDAGSINAVRSTLDRLVATSRVQRAGRGLYRATPS
ncbi:MAG: hypothetical protein HOY75_01555 [Streptomyces sp.]|nr:hypothetical protein [Streptomyces sp.]